MDLINVFRNTFHQNWTLSKYFIYDLLHGYGVEDEIREKKVKGETAIPYGRYPLGLRYSPRFSDAYWYNEKLNSLLLKKDYLKLKDKSGWKAHELIWVKDVPNFEYVLIHWGNTDLDTDGCYIVGNKIGVLNGREGVLESRSNYVKLYTKVYPLIKKGGQYINYQKA